MKTMNIIAKTALFALAVVSFTACSEERMDEINKDLNHSTDATANFIIPEIELNTAQNIVGGDFNTYFGCYVEHWTGTHNQLYNAEIRGIQIHAASTYNNVWAGIYENIRNAKIVVSKCSEGGSESSNELGHAVGNIMLAYDAALATDMFGDTPFSQVGDYKKYMTPDLDKQEEIYETVFGLLNEAIDILSGDPDNTLQSYDFIYEGDAEKWLKFAYGLKARYTMHLLNVSDDEESALKDVIEYVNKSFENADEQAKINVYDGNNINPVFDFEWSRDGISSSRSLYNKLVAHNDPRVNHAYVHSGGWNYLDAEAVEEYLPNNGMIGLEQSQYEFAYDASVFGETADVLLLSYHEILFLKAEAQARLGYDEALTTLSDAVEVAMANFNKNIATAVSAPDVVYYGGIEDPGMVSDDEIEEYMAEVENGYLNDPLKEVMIQKYFGMWGCNGESTETYNDVRRLKAMDEDIYDLENPGDFPLRAGYGTDDTSSNEFVRKAFGDGKYVYTEPVWWAGGTR